jgi:predicted  nucleic acid-binding Zn-ribbon protein
VEHSSISELKAPTSSVTTQKASNAAEARVRELELEIQRIKDKAVAQAEEALSAVEALSRENTELRAKLDGLNRDSAEELERELERLRLENRKLQEALDADQGHSSHFEEQVAAIKRQIGEELKSAQATIARLEGDVLRWKNSHQSLATTQQDELARVKGDYQEKIEDVRSQLTKLISSYQTLQMERDQMESKFALIDQELEDKVSGFQSKIEALNADLAALRAERDDMKLDLKKTKEFNAGLIEKNNILQYELTKSHAQSAGLNRICENFRTRVDELFKKVGSAEQQKKELTERQKSLEESLMAVEAEKNQLQAAEQKAKSALVQSETQISNLEKVYQEFRNRLKADGS